MRRGHIRSAKGEVLISMWSSAGELTLLVLACPEPRKSLGELGNRFAEKGQLDYADRRFFHHWLSIRQ
jgi:hypothetical protein